MKKKINYILLLSFFALITLFSCQNEAIEVNAPNNQETILPNSNLANLLQSTSANDCSQDDVLDNANCLSINLPVTVIVNDITITINTPEDLALITQIFNEFEDDEDILEFLFPITIILNDYSEYVINNEEELEAFIDECTDDDEVIECVDFQYPISFSLYNTDFQIIDTVVIENDEALYNFLNNLENQNDGVILASLNFPVTLIYANGESIEVANNQELETAINAAESNCESYNEDDTCSEQQVDANLQECYWKIVSYNGDDNFIQYQLFFNENGAFEIIDGVTTVAIGGNWQTSMSDQGVVLTLSELTAFNGDLGGEWLITECDNDRFELVNSNSTTIVIEQICETNSTNCSVDEVNEYLQTCIWNAVNYNGSNDLISFNLNFNVENMLSIYNSINNNEFEGYWNVSETANGIKLELANINGDLINEISGYWFLEECEFDRLQFTNESNEVLVLEKNCETQNNPFECFTSFDPQLVECDGDNVDGISIFNLTNVFANCIEPSVHNLTYHITLADAEANVNPISNPTEYTNIVNPQTIYVRVEINGSDVYEIFEMSLIVENCTNNGCTESQIDNFLSECIWNVVNYNNSNDLIVFDFNFNNDGTITITGEGATYTGMWSTTQTANGVYIELINIAGPNIQALNGNWLVVECEENRLELHIDDNLIVLERTCG